MMFALLLAAACSGDCTAQKRFDDFEKRLLAARALRVEGKLHTEGAASTDAIATLTFDADGTTTEDAKGRFMDAPFDSRLTTENGRLLIHSKNGNTEKPFPDSIREALIIGMTRMGMTHNVARLAQGNPPDHADGGAAKWLTAHDFAREGKDGVRYTLAVDGHDVAAVKVFFDAKTKLPVRRELVVQAGKSEMRVREDYSRFSVAASLPGK